MKKLNFRTIAKTVCSEDTIDKYIENIEKTKPFLKYNQYTVTGTSHCTGPRLIEIHVTKNNKNQLLNILFDSKVISSEEKTKLENKKIKTIEVKEIQ